MYKNLRKRKIKTLSKIAIPEDILMYPPSVAPEEPEYIIKIDDSFDGQHSLSYQGIVDESDISHSDYLIEGTRYHHYIGSIGPFESLNFYTEYYDVSEKYKEDTQRYKKIIEDFNKSEVSSKKDIDKINNLTFNDIIIKTRNVEGSYDESYIKVELDFDLHISFNDYSNRTENRINEINYDFEEVKLIIDKIVNKEEVSSSDKNLIVDLAKDYYFKYSIVRPYEGRITKKRIRKLDDLKKEMVEKENFIENPRFSYIDGSKLIKKSILDFYNFWTKIINKEEQRVDKKCYDLFNKSLNKFKSLKNIIYTYRLNPAMKADGVYLNNENTLINIMDSGSVTTHELLHHWDSCFKEYNFSCSNFTEPETLNINEMAEKYFDNKEYFQEFLKIYKKISTKNSSELEYDGVVRMKNFKEYLDNTYFDDEKKEVIMNYYYVYDDFYFDGSNKIYNFDIRTFDQATEFYSNKFSATSSVDFHNFETHHFHETYRFLKELIYKYSLDGINYKNIFNALTVSGPFKKEYYNKELRSFCALIKPTSENIQKLIDHKRIVKMDAEEDVSAKAFASNKNLRKRKIKALMKLSMPLEKNFDLHEEVQTNEKYLNALKFRLRKFPDNVYTISYSDMYKENDPWEMEKEQEFVKLIKEFFKDLPDEDFIEYIQPNLNSHGDLKKFIKFCKEKDFSFNGKYLHEEIKDPENSTLIIRNSPTRSLPSQGEGFAVNSFYFLHDVLCHRLLEPNKEMVKSIMDSTIKFVADSMKNYIDQEGNPLSNKLRDDYGYNEDIGFERNMTRFYGMSRVYYSEDFKKVIEEDDLYSENGYSIFNQPFVKHLINFKRKSGDDDAFCDFIASLFSIDINLLLKSKPFKDKRTSKMYYPNNNCEELSNNFEKEIKDVVSSDLYKSFYKNKVIYHPFYIE